MMKNVIKLSMIAALTMSSASVFAAAGDPVTGGQGNVTVDGTVQTNTCAVTVDKQALTVKLMKADFDKSGSGLDLPITGDAKSTFTLNNCNGQPIKVLIAPTSGAAITAMPPYWSIPGVTQLGVRLSTHSEKTTGAKWANINAGTDWTGVVNFTNPTLATGGIKLIPNADTAAFPVEIYLAKYGASAAAYTGPSSFTTGYTYNLTYL